MACSSAVSNFTVVSEPVDCSCSSGANTLIRTKAFLTRGRLCSLQSPLSTKRHYSSIFLPNLSHLVHYCHGVGGGYEPPLGNLYNFRKLWLIIPSACKFCNGSVCYDVHHVQNVDFYVHHVESVVGWHFFMYTMYRPCTPLNSGYPRYNGQY